MASESAVAGAIDYKFFCFNGEPRFLYVSQGLEVHATARMSFLSLDWEPLPFDRDEYRPFEVLPSQPESMGEMIRLARELSCGIPHVRVDFLERHGRPVLSEMTFYNCSGYMHLVPPEWDLEIGAMLRLPNEEAT